MVTTLHIKCPHCKQASQIFLSTSVSVIILNCPACLSPIMYFRKKVVLLDSHLAGHRHPKVMDIAPYLDKVVESQASELSSVIELEPKDRNNAGFCSQTEFGTPSSSRFITEDDCTNLRIELELCSDSKHFIENI